jgi:hypothetical protein
MRMICLILIIIGIAGAGMFLVDARSKKHKDPRLQLAWLSALLGWSAALIGFLF